VWEIPPESARRVGHPAPFPVELPEQLIRLYTYVDDLVLDPFMGSGSTLVAAARLGRRFVGYDLDEQYVAIARERVAAATTEPVPATPPDGRPARQIAEQTLTDAGFQVTGRGRRIRGTGVVVDLVVTDDAGREWFADVAGPNTTHRGGLLRTDVVWRALGRAAALRAARGDTGYLLLSTQLPKPSSEGGQALRAAGPELLTDVVDLLADDAEERLRRYAKGESAPVPGFWRPDDLEALRRR